MNKIIVIDDLSLSPNAYTKFVGVFINNKLSFNKHVDFLVTKRSPMLVTI